MLGSEPRYFNLQEKKRTRYVRRVYQLEMRTGKISCEHQRSHEHIGDTRVTVNKILNFSECIKLFCERCHLTFVENAKVPDPEFEFLS